jgi:hypothetical protein
MTKYQEKKLSIKKVLMKLSFSFEAGSWRDSSMCYHKMEIGQVDNSNIDEIADLILEKFGLKEKAKTDESTVS